MIPEVASKGTGVFVSIREKAMQIKRVPKKIASVLVKPGQVSEKVTMTSKLKFLNFRRQTDGKFHAGYYDVATLTENMFPECPERNHCETQISLMTHFYVPRLMILLMNLQSR